MARRTDFFWLALAEAEIGASELQLKRLSGGQDSFRLRLNRTASF